MSSTVDFRARSLLGLGLATASLAAAAHHSSSEYDESQVVEVQGEVVDVFWRNPHVVVKVATEQNGLQDSLAQIKQLKGFIPICAHCKKIRNDEGFWQKVEVYIEHHSDATFSHGVCPECIEKYYPGLGEKKEF